MLVGITTAIRLEPMLNRGRFPGDITVQQNDFGKHANAMIVAAIIIIIALIACAFALRSRQRNKKEADEINRRIEARVDHLFGGGPIRRENGADPSRSRRDKA